MTISNFLFFLITTAEIQLVTLVVGASALIALTIIVFQIRNRLRDYFSFPPVQDDEILKVKFDENFAQDQNNHTEDYFSIRFWLEKQNGEVLSHVTGKFIPNGNNRDLIGLLLFVKDDNNPSGISTDKVEIARKYNIPDTDIPKKLSETNPNYYFNVQGNLGQNTTDPETPVTHQEPRRP